MKHQLSTFLPVAQPDLTSLEQKYVAEAIRSTWISSTGPFVDRFERNWATFCGVEFGVSVCNGTVAMQLALRALGVGIGDEVIVPALTFVAVAAVVVHAGAKPVFVESQVKTGVMDPKAVERAIGPRTKGIIAVHLYGNAVDMTALMRLARRHGLFVIEDAAEAHGATYRGRTVGGIGHVGTFSFYGNKIVTTGEGGMVVTSDQALAERMRLLRDHAMDRGRRYWHTEVGYNFRLTNVQAALGCAQVQRVDTLIAKRRRIVESYREAFKTMPDVDINPSTAHANPAPWLVCAVLPKGTTRELRDELIAFLRQNGVDSRPYFFVATEMPPYRGFTEFTADGAGLCDIARDLSIRGVNLPTLAQLTPGKTRQIANLMRTFLRA